ncbi:uncharacterized protein CPUR_02826 [Claviceps purpurea 20.1]|uniref:Uncharacterized protein n=1 Tax=Claviceps purpurea (strain 20.1) TaxID=1111077 RepID=M1W482_CLAP2|nr:uncharacterized protein CPUR_02826 [Claviceps purpurea 20.1]
MASSTRSTPRLEPGLPEQHCGASDTNLQARVEDLRKEVELMELKNRRTRAAMEAKRLEMDNLPNLVGLHVSHHPDQLTDENVHEIMNALSDKLPGVAREDMDDVRTGKMEPWNLIRLCSPIITTNESYETHTAADLIDDPLLFPRSFGIYTLIYASFFIKQHPDVVLAQLDFASFIMLQARISPWKICLEYAMNRLGSIMRCSIHDAKAWLRQPVELIYAYFMAPAATMASTNSKPSTHNKRRRANTHNSSEVCLRFNSRRRCRTRDCHRRHVCSICEGPGHTRGACQRR